MEERIFRVATSAAQDASLSHALNASSLADNATTHGETLEEDFDEEMYEEFGDLEEEVEDVAEEDLLAL
ncbi:hypothetical protein HK096_007467, partial [Nowakowskiella sp. JEL0078]